MCSIEICYKKDSAILLSDIPFGHQVEITQNNVFYNISLIDIPISG
jgi:hypothetical protein